LHADAVPAAEFGALLSRLDRLCDEGEALYMQAGLPLGEWRFTVEEYNGSKPLRIAPKSKVEELEAKVARLEEFLSAAQAEVERLRALLGEGEE
jgi:hypothetical protein